MISKRWRQGHEIITDQKFKLPRESFFQAIQGGAIIPHREKEPSLYPDPDEPPGFERFYPTLDLEKKYNRLSWLRYERKWWTDPPKEAEAWTAEEAKKKIAGLEKEIRELEKFLEPAGIWNFTLTPYHEELLLDAWYWLEPAKEGKKKKLSDHQIAWIEVEAKANELLKHYPKMTLAEIAEHKDIKRILEKHFDQGPMIETIIKKLQGKLPIKRGRRKLKQR